MSLDVNISEPDEFNCIELHNCIETVAKINNIKDFTYHVDILCNKGENFIANIFRVSIKDSESEKNTSVIVKTLINTTRQELFRELHAREVIAYRDVIEKYDAIQNKFNVVDRINIPKCIFSSISKNNEVIVLEDLLLSGFTIDSKLANFEKLDFPQVCLIVTELAKFHAISLVYETTHSSFEKVRDAFEDLIFQDSFLNKTKLKDYFQESFQMSLDVIEDGTVKKQLEVVKQKLLDLLKMYTKPKKFNVFCHGDCWINNVLFKYEGTKRELCFVDFQAMRYASPVTDILYFLYICTDSEFRSQYYHELTSAYYNKFETFLKQYNIEANLVYPKESFESDLQEMMPFGLLAALLELRLVTTSHEDQAILKEVNVENEETGEVRVLSEDKLYAIRVNDVVNEAINNGVLQNLLNIANS